MLKLHVSTLDCSLQEEFSGEEAKGEEEGVKDKKTPDIILKIGGQFIGLQEDIDNIFNKELSLFSSMNVMLHEFLQHYKLQVVFTKSPNLGNLIVKTKL